MRRFLCVVTLLLAALLAPLGVRAAPSAQIDRVLLFSSQTTVAQNGLFSYSITVLQQNPDATVTVTMPIPDALQIIAANSLQHGQSGCSTTGQVLTCTLPMQGQNSDVVTITVLVRPGVPAGTVLTTHASLDSGLVSEEVQVRVGGVVVTPPAFAPTTPPLATVAPTAVPPSPTAVSPPTQTPPGFVSSPTSGVPTRTPTATPMASPTPYGGVWVEKRISQWELTPGAEFAYYLHVHSGQAQPQTVRIIDLIVSPAYRIESVSANRGSCTVTPLRGNQRIDCRMEVARGQSVEITMRARVGTDPAVLGAQWSNTATVYAGAIEMQSNTVYGRVRADIATATVVAPPTVAPPWYALTATPPGDRGPIVQPPAVGPGDPWPTSPVQPGDPWPTSVAQPGVPAPIVQPPAVGPGDPWPTSPVQPGDPWPTSPVQPGVPAPIVQPLPPLGDPPWYPTQTPRPRPTRNPQAPVATATDVPPASSLPVAVQPAVVTVPFPETSASEATFRIFTGAGIGSDAVLVVPTHPDVTVQINGAVCGRGPAAPGGVWTDTLACPVAANTRYAATLRIAPNARWRLGATYDWPVRLINSVNDDVLGRAGGAFRIGPVAVATPTPSVDTGAACYIAVQAALSKVGSPYSQGGVGLWPELDPRDAAGNALPRKGPNSFDCSGLVHWSYAQGGITVPDHTTTIIRTGDRIPCTLDDLDGPNTTCWAPGDTLNLVGHVGMYAGNGMVVEAAAYGYGVIVSDVSNSRFYRDNFLHGRRITNACEGMTIDPGMPVEGDFGDRTGDPRICLPNQPAFPDGTGVNYGRGCGPPVQPEIPGVQAGSQHTQFDGRVGYIGDTGVSYPDDSTRHLELRVRFEGDSTDLCRVPYQVDGHPEGAPPPGAAICDTAYSDPLDFLSQAGPESLQVNSDGTAEPVAYGDPSDPAFDDAVYQLPPPGDDANFLLDPPPGEPGGVWWSPGNLDRLNDAPCPIGGPSVWGWFRRLLATMLPWFFGC